MSSALVGLPQLVGDDADLVAVRRQAQHGLDEIGAERAVDPGRAQDRDIVMRRQHGLFAGQLGRAIDAGRAGRVGLDVGPRFGAVEDISRSRDGSAARRAPCAAAATARAPPSLTAKARSRSLSALSTAV